MIGIFDSGIGGLNSLQEYKRLRPSDRVIYLMDSERAPYGTKSKDEIISIVRDNIDTLRRSGAEKILIACCTASTVWGELDDEYRSTSLPIITPTVKEALRIGKRIALIGTELTVKGRCFSNTAAELCSDAQMLEISAQPLVLATEEGCRDGRISSRTGEYLDSLCAKINRWSPQVLILGCTHFSYLEKEISKRLKGCRTVNSAKVGAKTMAKLMKKQSRK